MLTPAFRRTSSSERIAEHIVALALCRCELVGWSAVDGILRNEEGTLLVSGDIQAVDGDTGVTDAMVEDASGEVILQIITSRGPICSVRAAIVILVVLR
jgi:hypothetical protein